MSLGAAEGFQRPVDTVKQPTKEMVCGMVSFRGLSGLHIVPHGKTLTSDFYVDEVLKGMGASAMR